MSKFNKLVEAITPKGAGMTLTHKVKYVNWSVDRGGIQGVNSGFVTVTKLDVKGVMEAYFTQAVNYQKEYGESYVFDITNYDYEVGADSVVVEDNDGVERWVFTKV